MKINLEPIKNKNIYDDLKTFKNGNLLLETQENWSEFFLQNNDRKRNNNSGSNKETYIKKRILKNIKGFELLIEQIKFNQEVKIGFFLDYSSYVNIFQYFKDNNDIYDYVLDLCEARGEKPIKSPNDAIDYLVSEGVVISKINSIYIDETEWNNFKSLYETKEVIKN